MFVMALQAPVHPPASNGDSTAQLWETGLGWNSESCFTVSDLFKDDTNGFIRVVNTVDRLLQLLEQRGRLLPPSPDETYGCPNDGYQPTTPADSPTFHGTSNRATPGPPLGPDSCPLAKVIQELLTTERNYVADLERIQAFVLVLTKYEALGRDLLYSIFGNLDQIVDVQRRLLTKIEQVLCPPTTSKGSIPSSWTCGRSRWNEVERQAHALGRLFSTMVSELCIYQPFCANYAHALAVATKEAAAITSVRALDRPDVDQCFLDPYYSLGAFLIKPVQRICKYHLLFDVRFTHLSLPLEILLFAN